MKKQKPARRDTAQFGLKWIFASLAGLLFIAAYLPKHPIQELTTSYKTWGLRRRPRQG